MAQLKSTQVHGDLNVTGEARVASNLVHHAGNQLDIGTTAAAARTAIGLGSVTNGATVNQSDAYLLARANQTGTQPVSTITGLGNAATRNVGTAINTIMAGDDSRVVANTTKLAGIATGATKNRTDASVDTLLANKVDKVTGKELSTNDYTTVEKSKLTGIAAGATKNATDVQLRDRASHTGTQAVGTITGLGNAATRNVGTTANTIMAGDDSRVIANTSKLSGIATGATKNATDAYLLNRANHTGVQTTSTITGLDAALLAKVDKVTGKGLSTNDYTTVEKSKLTGIATGATKNATDAQLRARSSHTGTQAIGTVTGLQAAIDGKVDKVLDKSLIDDSEITRLGGIATGATKNATDAQLRVRSSHTGTQAISTIAGLQAGLDAKVNIVAGKDLSTEDYSTADKTKLVGIAVEATKNRADSENADKVHTHTVAQVTGLGDALDNKVDTSNIAQTTGQSTTNLMSQKATTDAINTAVAENGDSSGPRPIKDHGNVAVGVGVSQTVTCDVQESDFHIMSISESGITGTLTIDFSNMPDTLGKHFSWHVRLQRGARKTVEFAQTINWVGGLAPTFGSYTNSQDLMLFYKVDSETIRGMVIDAW